MFFGLSEEQEQFQDYVKKFLADNVTVDEIRKIANGEDGALAKEIYSGLINLGINACLLYTSPSPRDLSTSRMPSSA